ncbi:MAG: tetraacyldisaccharide 4'-kinase [Bacteroidales bacterium]|nr:tetraacyldisaccharide 4'-kinase [Bacteroidales bacterium]
MKYFKYILFPFSICYWLFTFVRNKCFDWGILSQTSFDLPIISVGNITVGGTGKTPHVQYIVELLKNKNIASLSRGYKRKSKGFVLATEHTTVSELGDEPFLLQKRFPKLHVAVCEKRVVGVQELQKNIPNLDAVILDDAYQHRYIKPSKQILLIDYNRPLWRDCVFPVGFLREGKYAVSRADVVVVSKCPNTMLQQEADNWRNRLSQFSGKIFFSSMEYGAIYNFATKQLHEKSDFGDSQICVITGIAQPGPLFDYLDAKGFQYISKVYPDHYSYSEKDRETLQQMSEQYTILTTEKDVYKLAEILPNDRLYVLPIMPQILFNQTNEFEQTICSF